jgi:hypothetical protein
VTPIPRGYRLRPVAAVQGWLQAAEITEGPVFRHVHRSGAVRAAGLSGAAPVASAEPAARFYRRSSREPVLLMGTRCFDRHTCHDNTPSARLRNLAFVPWQNFNATSSVVSRATESGKRARHHSPASDCSGVDKTD